MDSTDNKDNSGMFDIGADESDIGKAQRDLEGRFRDLVAEETAKTAVTAAQPMKGVTRAALHNRVYNLRKYDKMPRVVGTKCWASDRVLAQEMFKARRIDKPPWATAALVRLRAAGICEVCEEVVSGYNSGRVVRLVPPSLGGQFAEPNAMFVCDECSKVWPRKNFFLTNAFAAHVQEVVYYVLSRRVNGVNGSKLLSAPALELFNKVKFARHHLMEDIENLNKQFSEKVKLAKASSDESLIAQLGIAPTGQPITQG